LGWYPARFPGAHGDGLQVEIGRHCRGTRPKRYHVRKVVKIGDHTCTIHTVLSMSIHNVSDKGNRGLIQSVAMKKENRSVDRYQQASRLRQARLQAGYATAAAFARAHGLGEADYRHKENANRGISVADAKAYASILAPKIGAHFTWSYILDGEKSSQATMMGYIGAGDQIFPFDDEHAWDSIAAPPDLKNPLAAIVHGDSMLPVYRDGDILFFWRNHTRNSALDKPGLRRSD
jgi:hypothetical protein